jgi:DNA-binding NarL/FixJ family response regulator
MRVIVADDDVLLRAGLPSLLERSGFAVAGEAGDAEELLDLVRTHAPDLVIVDIRMPPTHTEEGLEAARNPGGVSAHRDPAALRAHRGRACDGAAGQR